MKRRDLLKGLTTVAGGTLLPSSAWPFFAQQPNQNTTVPLAVPIRALARRNGTLMQPIQIAIQNSGAPATAVTKLNGVEVDSRVVPQGAQTFPVFLDPVNTAQEKNVRVSIGDQSLTAVANLQPVRKVLVYILPHSHHDLGYTDIQSRVEEKQMHNIELGIDLARKTSTYPEGARFVWNLEVLWGADLYMQRKSDAEKAAFIDAVKKGWVSLNGMYGNELTGLCRPEELLQLFRYGLELARQCGVNLDAAMISDVPGYTWGTITALAQAGIRYFSCAPNRFDRIGRIMEVWQDKPFWHLSPSGKEKALVWVPWLGYGFSHVEKALSAELVAAYQDRLDSIQFPYEISYERWAGHGDNALPDPQICEFIKSWNEEYEWPRFAISSTSAAFSAFEKCYGSILPEYKGDLTPYWEDGAGSSALETRMNRNAADRIVQAEALAARLPAAARRTARFHEAWRNVLLYSEHTWGAAGSVSNPESPMTTSQWEVKRGFALAADRQSGDLLAEVLSAVDTTNDSSLIDVHNSTSWSRNELVLLAAELSKTGDRVRDERGLPVASQRLSTGELAFLVRDLPPFASARFRLSSGKPHEPAAPATVADGVLSNGVIRAKVDSATGNLVEFALQGKGANLIDVTHGEAANQYLFLEGSDVAGTETSGTVTVTVEETGPLVCSFRIASSAPGCNSLVRRVRLIAGADWIEISNVVDKKRALIDPHPDDPAFARQFAQHGAKESVQFAFPFNVPDGEMHLDIPLGEMRPEKDQLPGACKNWLPVGRWVDVANAGHGVTWVTLDAPLIEVGEISANLLGSQTDPSAWRDHIEPTQRIYSWVMNNHWSTNYRAYQEGPVEFRYALRATAGYDPAAASRFAIGLSQPLIASSASPHPPSPSMLRIEPSDVLALTLKTSEDGKAWMVRLFGASGELRVAKLRWHGVAPPKLWLSDLAETPLQALDGDVTVAGWELVTLRADRPE